MFVETAALCDICVMSALYKSSYLLTYLTHLGIQGGPKKATRSEGSYLLLIKTLTLSTGGVT